MSAAEQLSGTNPTHELSVNGAKAYDLIRSKGGLSFVEKTILKDLAMRIGAEGSMWATHRRIAQDAGCARSTVQEALDRLEERELVLVHRPRRTTLRRHPNHYALNLVAVRALPPVVSVVEDDNPEPDVPEWVRGHRTQKTRIFSDSPPVGPSMARPPGHAKPAGRSVDGLPAGLEKTLSQDPEKPEMENARTRATSLCSILEAGLEQAIGAHHPAPALAEPMGVPAEPPAPVASEAARGEPLDVEPIESHEPIEAPTVGVPVQASDEVEATEAPTDGGHQTTEPSPVSGEAVGADLAAAFLDDFRRLRAERHKGRPLANHREDETHALTIVNEAIAVATSQHAHGPEGRSVHGLVAELLGCWIGIFLARPGAPSEKHPQGFLLGAGHPLVCFARDVRTLGEPLSWRAARRHHEQQAAAARDATARATRDAEHARQLAARVATVRRTASDPRFAVPRLGGAPPGSVPAPLRRAVIKEDRAVYERAATFLHPSERAELLALLAIHHTERTQAQRWRFNQLLVAATTAQEQSADSAAACLAASSASNDTGLLYGNST